MWTTENRIRYDRIKRRYPSDLTDEEWAVIGPLIPRAKRGGNKRTSSRPRRGARTACAVQRIHHALYVACREQAGRETSPTAAITDSQSVKSAEKGGPRSTRMVTTLERRSRGASVVCHEHAVG